jgi:hypothetical protein
LGTLQHLIDFQAEQDELERRSRPKGLSPDKDKKGRIRESVARHATGGDCERTPIINTLDFKLSPGTWAGMVTIFLKVEADNERGTPRSTS